MTNIRVTKVSDGLGFGTGSISVASLKESVDGSVVDAAADVIESADILVPVDTDENGKPLDDDGCGDGRAVGKTYQGGTQKRRSLNRPKVFGGGATMGLAALVAEGKAHDAQLSDLFKTAMVLLNQRGVDFGAHTADHTASSDDCGCGAIDKAPAIIQAACDNRAVITHTIEALGFATEELDEVFARYEKLSAQLAVQSYRGADVAAAIKAEGKVVKELTGGHHEAFIVLNTVPGHTVNQQVVRDATHDAVQAFAVDVWRLRDLARRMTANEAEDAVALLGELVYTLATAAVLTRGDLPVYVITEK